MKHETARTNITKVATALSTYQMCSSRKSIAPEKTSCLAVVVVLMPKGVVDNNGFLELEKLGFTVLVEKCVCVDEDDEGDQGGEGDGGRAEGEDGVGGTVGVGEVRGVDGVGGDVWGRGENVDEEDGGGWLYIGTIHGGKGKSSGSLKVLDWSVPFCWDFKIWP